MYKRYIPQLNFSIERNTDNVPSDGKYYLLKNGKIIESFRSQKKADEKFEQLIKESGYKPEKRENQTTNQVSETLDRFLSDRIIFHSEGAKFRNRGGRGR